MLNFYYSLEINLDNEHVKEKLAPALKDLISSSTNNLVLRSRFFNTTTECFDVLHEDLNSKIEVLKIKEMQEVITSINETNPTYRAPPEKIDELMQNDPEFSEYSETWAEDELMRLTYTTEEFDEDELPFINDDKALMFRYVMHEFNDGLDAPEEKLVIENASSVLH